MVGASTSSVRRRSIIIVGFMAVGKTTVGRLLAARLGLPFVDTDQQIETAFGCSIADIFATYGESEFRAAERGLIKCLLDGEPRILSLGGGACSDEAVRRMLNDQGTTVWLDAPFDRIVERLARSSNRPLARGRPVGELERLWQERRHGYAEAHLHVETRDWDADKTVEQILQALP